MIQLRRYQHFLAIVATGFAALVASGDSNHIFVESDGIVAAEAESFYGQSKDEVRRFYHVSQNSTASLQNLTDGDPPHLDGSSANAYLEILPDTRRTHADKLIHGENFMPRPGEMAIVSYRVRIKNPGRYYVWVRAYSTGSEDNGLHVGLNGDWPASGQRLQWCQGKNSWRWESKQRTEKNHCGEPHKIFLDIEKPGDHIVSFSMREDGFEFDKWFMTKDRDFVRPEGTGPKPTIDDSNSDFAPPQQKSTAMNKAAESEASRAAGPLVLPRRDDGDGSVAIEGDAKVWHTVTLVLDGPFAHENDNVPNPFMDYRVDVTFRDGNGAEYLVPGYFASDGDAANSSSESGTKWKVHFTPQTVGKLDYEISFRRGKNVALDRSQDGDSVAKLDGVKGTITIAESDVPADRRDLRGHGRLQYVGKNYLQFSGSRKYFLKAGADAPETLLAYVDFDNTTTRKPKQGKLKSWQAHVQDWRPGDPTWQGEKGKGLIGAINYLSSKGCNAFSFLTYNAGGDGDNVWPFVERDDKQHYDCSKLDQWGIVFEHATTKGMYLHFKTQETENDDNRTKGKTSSQSRSTEANWGGIASFTTGN